VVHVGGFAEYVDIVKDTAPTVRAHETAVDEHSR
jgi:hypothetical protein